MSDNNRVLVVDDDSDVRWMIKKYLEKNNLQVDTADGGEQMREFYAKNSYDVIILDVTMPGEDGLSLAKFLRGENYAGGIIMCTAASEVVDCVVGLEVGADDYVTKPFEPRELFARVKSLLRRINANATLVENSSDRVLFGEYSLDLQAQQLIDKKGEEIAITSMEFDLLKAFAENPNKVLNRDQLLNLAHDKDWDPYDRSIDIRVTRLRKKIEVDPSKPQIIKTVRGAGYKFVTPT